jgi:hypothetical protein
MKTQMLLSLPNALMLPFFVSCDPGSGTCPSSSSGDTAPEPATKKLTTAELIYNKDAAAEERLGEQSEALAGALKEYVAANKKWPARIENLHPDFIADKDAFWIHYGTPDGPAKTRFVLLAPSTYRAPDSEGMSIIAFTIDPIPLGDDGRSKGRMVIDSTFNTWFAGEWRFYEFLCGKDIMDGGNLPSRLPSVPPILPDEPAK